MTHEKNKFEKTAKNFSAEKNISIGRESKDKREREFEVKGRIVRGKKDLFDISRVCHLISLKAAKERVEPTTDVARFLLGDLIECKIQCISI